jgi:hypothetical protein
MMKLIFNHSTYLLLLLLLLRMLLHPLVPGIE